MQVVHQSNAIEIPAGRSVRSIRRSLRTPLNLSPMSYPLVDGHEVDEDYTPSDGDRVIFVEARGVKGVGPMVWNGDEFCTLFKITPEDLDAWICQGLKVGHCLDGSLRITETAVDEFFRGRVIESPYLSTDEAAAYCNVSKDAFYGRVERKKISPLPGSGKENRFTREQCDAMMKGERR